MMNQMVWGSRRSSVGYDDAAALASVQRMVSSCPALKERVISSSPRAPAAPLASPLTAPLATPLLLQEQGRSISASSRTNEDDLRDVVREVLDARPISTAHRGAPPLSSSLSTFGDGGVRNDIVGVNSVTNHVANSVANNFVRNGEANRWQALLNPQARLALLARSLSAPHNVSHATGAGVGRDFSRQSPSQLLHSLLLLKRNTINNNRRMSRQHHFVKQPHRKKVRRQETTYPDELVIQLSAKDRKSTFPLPSTSQSTVPRDKKPSPYKFHSFQQKWEQLECRSDTLDDTEADQLAFVKELFARTLSTSKFDRQRQKKKKQQQHHHEQ